MKSLQVVVQRKVSFSTDNTLLMTTACCSIMEVLPRPRLDKAVAESQYLYDRLVYCKQQFDKFSQTIAMHTSMPIEVSNVILRMDRLILWSMPATSRRHWGAKTNPATTCGLALGDSPFFILIRALPHPLELSHHFLSPFRYFLHCFSFGFENLHTLL